MKRLLWEIAGWPLGLLLWACSRLVLATSRVTGDDLPTGAVIYVNWHRHLSLLMPLHGRDHRWMMMSGAPYMAPIARWARLCGLELIRGASGEGGRAALAILAEKLASGASLTLAVDGPAGPPFVAKSGCADLALQTGAPVVAVAWRARGAFAMPRRWDRQLLVLPFARITVVRSDPVVRLPGESRDALLARIQHALEALEDWDH